MVELKQLTKCYGKQAVFRQLNYRFPDSGLVCLLGASGCGKTTLLHMIAGFDREYHGEILVSGTNIHKLNSEELCLYRRQHVGFIFQHYNLLMGYTVLENVLLASPLHKGSESQHREKAVELLNRLHLSDKLDEKIENLSGGQKQRVGIARTLLYNPSIILADEPTGALDRKNANEIMELLKEIAKDRLVLVITHDEKICAYGDGTITIENGKILGKEITNTPTYKKLLQKDTLPHSSYSHGLKNFKVHWLRYMAVALSIGIGIFLFIMSLSSRNIMSAFITDFKEKNTAHQNGYIKVDKAYDELLSMLESDQRIEQVYKQYKLKDISLTMDKKVEKIGEKFPTPKASEIMSYGTMPKTGEQTIALSPSLAKKFDSDISKLIGKQLTLRYGGNDYTLKVSGIYNADYDDFFVSSDVEQTMYQQQKEEQVYAISYDVKAFEDVVSVRDTLESKGFTAVSAAKEVASLQTTFNNLSRLFLFVSCLILIIGIYISTILLVKLQNSRYKEVGLLSALGFRKAQIQARMLYETIFLSLSAISINIALLLLAYGVSSLCNLTFMIALPQVLLSIFTTGILVVFISLCASHKLMHTQPSDALKK